MNGDILSVLAVCFWFGMQAFTAYNSYASNQRAKNIEEFLLMMQVTEEEPEELKGAKVND